MAGERTLAGLGLTAFWNLGDASYKPGLDTNLLVLSSVVHLSVISWTASLPGAPANGDRYLVSGGGNDNKIAIRDNGAWVYLTPVTGWIISIQDLGHSLRIWNGSQWRPITADSFTRFIDKGTIGTGTVTFNRYEAAVQRLQVSGALTMAFSNWPAAGMFAELLIELVNGGAAALTWPTVTWIKPDGTEQSTPPRTPKTSGKDWIGFWTRDGGLTVYGRFL